MEELDITMLEGSRNPGRLWDHLLHTGKDNGTKYVQFGNINRIAPKILDGQDVRAGHYPPTKSELEKFSNKSGKPK